MVTDARSFINERCIPKIVFRNVLSLSRKYVKTQCIEKAFHYSLIQGGGHFSGSKGIEYIFLFLEIIMKKMREMSREDTKKKCHGKCQ